MSQFIKRASGEIGFVRKKFGLWTTFQEYVWFIKGGSVSTGLQQL